MRTNVRWVVEFLAIVSKIFASESTFSKEIWIFYNQKEWRVGVLVSSQISKAEDTKVNTTKEAIKRLRSHNAPVAGAVLTVAEPSKMSYYGDHYYASEYYGDVDPKELKVASV